MGAHTSLREEDLDSVVFFDGVCYLCQGAVRFIFDRDPDQFIKYSSLQSSFGKSTLERVGYRGTDFDSIVFLHHGKILIKSNAVLEITRLLRWPWPMLFGLKIIPLRLRDWIYDWVAKNRYAWFGKSKDCSLMPFLKEGMIIE